MISYQLFNQAFPISCLRKYNTKMVVIDTVIIVRYDYWDILEKVYHGMIDHNIVTTTTVNITQPYL